MTPKDKENIAILVKSIIEKDHGMICIKDSALIPYYVHNSKYMAEVEFTDKSNLTYNSCKGEQYSDDFNGLKKKQLELAEKADANYIFVSNFYHKDVLLGVITPFRIISEKEEEFLLKSFYKDVPKKVSEAAKQLGIVIYDKLYSYYMKENTSELLDVITSKYNPDKYDPVTCEYNQNKYDHFIDFIFNLPYEEQNIESNKKILRTSFSFLGFYDLIGMMTKEYSEGKYFREYFEAISSFEGKKVVDMIKGLERKPDYDVYLLKKGYIMGEDSAVGLYRQDAKLFMNYFQKLGVEAQKILIEKIYEDPFVNQEVVDWLEKDYMHLLREVGFSGGKQDECKNRI